MVGARCAAYGAVVEDDVAGHGPCELAHGAEVAVDRLRGVAPCGYGEVLWQYGEGVDEQLVVFQGRELVLLRRSVVVAQEAGPRLDAGGVGGGRGALYACGVELCYEPGVLPEGQLARLNALGEVAVALGGLGPLLDFLPEEVVDVLGREFPLPLLVEMLPGHDFEAAQVVFVLVVAVYALLAEGGVAVALPSAAQV